MGLGQSWVGLDSYPAGPLNPRMAYFFFPGAGFPHVPMAFVTLPGCVQDEFVEKAAKRAAKRKVGGRSGLC